MKRRAALFMLLLPLLAAKEPVNLNHAETPALTIDATIVDREGTKQLLGSDMQGYYTVVKVTVTPRAGKINVQRDDFLLRTFKDGEHSKPLSPTEIAGNGALVVKENGRTSGMASNRSPEYGGLGIPLPGRGPTIGNTSGATTATAKMDNGTKGKVNPMLKVLEEKMLPEKETAEPVSGLLLFPLEKQRLKDLQLEYTTAQGPLKIVFH